MGIFEITLKSSGQPTCGDLNGLLSETNINDLSSSIRNWLEISNLLEKK